MNWASAVGVSRKGVSLVMTNPSWARVLIPKWAGTLSKNTASPKATTAWCHAAFGHRNRPGTELIPTATQRLTPATQAHQLAGSQLDTTSYQLKSGDSNCAVCR